MSHSIPLLVICILIGCNVVQTAEKNPNKKPRTRAYELVNDMMTLSGRNQSSEGASSSMDYHICLDQGEAYAASFLVTTNNLMRRYYGKVSKSNFCEQGSLSMMSVRNNVQSLDVLDYSVIHLSSYERSQRRVRKELKLPSINDNVTSAVRKALDYIRLSETSFDSSTNLNRTLVLMPYLAATTGQGNSRPHNRYLYLAACFWSIHKYMPNIVIGVSNSQDEAYVRSQSGLPVYDIIHLPNLPTNASLPVALVLAAKQKLQRKQYDFDFVYYTESDQILLLRKPDALYSLFLKNDRYVLLPHRLMAYAEEAITFRLNTTSIMSETIVDAAGRRSSISSQNALLTWRRGDSLPWTEYTCYIPRQLCRNRNGWVDLLSGKVPIIKIYGLYVPLGNSNYHRESYRTCVFSSKYM